MSNLLLKGDDWIVSSIKQDTTITKAKKFTLHFKHQIPISIGNPKVTFRQFQQLPRNNKIDWVWSTELRAYHRRRVSQRGRIARCSHDYQIHNPDQCPMSRVDDLKTQIFRIRCYTFF